MRIGWAKVDSVGNSRRPWVILNVNLHGFAGVLEKSKLLESCFIRDMPKPFHELRGEVMHLFQFPCVAGYDGMFNSIFKMWLDIILSKGEACWW